MNDSYRAEIRHKIRHKPRLSPVFGGAHDVPERIYEYNPRLFLCFNAVTERFEIHNLDQAESYCATLPYKSLDARTLRWIWNNDIRVHGMRIFEELAQGDERREKQKQRDFKNWVQDVASETRSMLAKDAWTFGT